MPLAHGIQVLAALSATTVIVVDRNPEALEFAKTIGATHGVVADGGHIDKVKELALFGSVLRDDFAADSDVDVLIELNPDSTVSLWDVPEMEDELAALFGRRADLVFKGGLRNPFRRHEILSTRQVVYAA